MKFKTFHNDFFKSNTGSFSRVTERENYDSQITLTDIESQIVISYFGRKSIHIGGVSNNPKKATKEFLLYPDFKPIHLNLVFPKPDKSELRLYISNRAGFKPRTGEIWFMYENELKKLVIGSLDERVWNGLGQEDTDDDSYQKSIEETIYTTPNIIDTNPRGRIIKTTIGSKTIINRDPKLAIMRFQLTNNRCEIDPDHETFIAERTKLPYVEAHHFIPIKFQHLFQHPLDNLDNIVSLCPNCHRGIHHGIINYKHGLIENLYKKRPQMHQHSIEDIAQYYNAIRVPDA